MLHRYLQAYLDTLIHRQIQRMQRLRATAGSPQNVFDAISFSTDQAFDLLARPFGKLPDEPEDADPSKAEYTRILAELQQQQAAEIETAQARGESLPFEEITTAFGLDEVERNILLICLAPELDLRYEKLYGYLLDDLTRKRPTVNLILDLLCEPGPERLKYLSYFDSERPLRKHRLIEPVNEPGIQQPPLLNQAFAPGAGIMAVLLGQAQVHPEIQPFATLTEPTVDCNSESADTEKPRVDCHLLSAEIKDAVKQLDINNVIAVFYGRDLLPQQAAAQLWAATQKRPLLTLDLAAVRKGGGVPADAVRLALRDARLAGAVAQICGWDQLLEEGAPPVALMAAIDDHPGPLWFAFEHPGHQQRCELLGKFLQNAKQSAPVTSLGLSALADQFVLTTVQLRDVVWSAVDLADQAQRPLCIEDLFAAARWHSNPNLDQLARKLQARYDWDDIVLPDLQKQNLHELIEKIKLRRLVLDDWQVGARLVASKGMTALFAGDPGTGKTMAAEVVAYHLKMDIYKIDLSSMVSKFIGETEKNLERVFREAENSNAILFFDEADAIFGKRSEVKDAHDRYANIEVGYLLQRMEAYDGVTILATNLRANLDAAFTRRFATIVDFPFPEVEERAKIWQKLFAITDIPRESLDLARMAHSFKLAGGNISNIIVDAAYRAAANGQVVTMPHLLESTRRELQKMGRLADEKDFALNDNRVANPKFR
jgi:hypothetical protein